MPPPLDDTGGLPPPPPGFGEVHPIERAEPLPSPPAGFAAPTPLWTRANPLVPKTQEDIENAPAGAWLKHPKTNELFSKPVPAPEVDQATGQELDFSGLTAAPKPPGWIGTAYEAGKKGIVSGFTEAAHAPTAFRERPPEVPDTSPVGELLGQPISQGWADPKWWIAHIVHGAAASAPSLATGAAGAFAGSAAGSAVPGVGTAAGALVGGAGGFALGSAIQTIAPAYQKARSDGLDHDAAVNRAIETSGVAAAFGGAMGLAPIFAPLKGAVSNALLQIFAAQPALGLGQMATTGALEGKMPTLDELGTAYAEQAGMGAALVGGHAAARWALGRPGLPPGGAEPEVAPPAPGAPGTPSPGGPPVGSAVNIDLGNGPQRATVARRDPDSGDVILTDPDGVEHRLTATDVAKYGTPEEESPVPPAGGQRTTIDIGGERVVDTTGPVPTPEAVRNARARGETITTPPTLPPEARTQPRTQADLEREDAEMRALVASPGGIPGDPIAEQLAARQAELAQGNVPRGTPAPAEPESAPPAGGIRGRATELIRARQPGTTVSTGWLMQQLKIDRTDANNVLAGLEQEGIVGPKLGNNQRRVMSVERVPTPTPPPVPKTPAEMSREEFHEWARANRIGRTAVEPVPPAPEAQPIPPGGYRTAKGSVYEVHEDGTTTRNKSFHPEHGVADQGPQPRSEATFYVTPDEAQMLGEVQAIGPYRPTVAPVGDGRWGVKYTAGDRTNTFEHRTVVTPQTEPAVGLTPVEIFNGGARVHFGNEITEVASKPGPPTAAQPVMRLYRGEGDDQEKGGGWFTTDPEKAALYGPVSYIDVTRDDMRRFAQGANGPDEWLTDDAAIRARARSVEPVGGAPAELPAAEPSSTVPLRETPQRIPEAERIRLASEHEATEIRPELERYAARPDVQEWAAGGGDLAGHVAQTIERRLRAWNNGFDAALRGEDAPPDRPNEIGWSRSEGWDAADKLLNPPVVAPEAIEPRRQIELTESDQDKLARLAALEQENAAPETGGFVRRLEAEQAAQTAAAEPAAPPAPERPANAPTVSDEIHTKTRKPIYAVRFPEKPDIEGVGAQARKMGGYWSSFRGGGMQPGWMFKTRESADRFAAWARGEEPTPTNGTRPAEQITADVERARDQTNPEPTPAQAEAGNYEKGKLSFQGLPFVIETPAGEFRNGPPDENGAPRWRAQMPADTDYGYVSKTTAKDGDHIDMFLGPDHASQLAWVVDQVHADTKAYDEAKILAGFPDEASARAAYEASFSDGRGAERIGNITPMSLDELKAWLAEGDTKNPVGQTYLSFDGEVPTSSTRPPVEETGYAGDELLGAVPPGDVGAGPENAQGVAPPRPAGPAPQAEGPRGAGDVQRPPVAAQEPGDRGAPSGDGNRPGDIDRVPAGAEAEGQPGAAGRPAGPGGERPAPGRVPDLDEARPIGEPKQVGRAVDLVTGENHVIEPGSVAEDRTPRIKARDNIAAIELAKALIDEGRPATKEEQAILAKYVGWGGLSNVFPDPHTGLFRKEFEVLGPRLKQLLTPDEYRTAARSVLNAHYTSEPVVRAMWNAVERMGFKGGTVFEPGMGIGHFLGMMPPDLAAASKYQGIEMDHLTAQIAKLLYPQSGVRRADFTQQPMPRDVFDLAIGNPPFADVKITSDPKYAARGFMLHDYFFAKSLDSVRPGGLLAFVTSAGTMTKLDDAARRYMAERAEFVGGVMLPSSAFSKNAGTEVTTSILFFKKRPTPIDLGEKPPEWTETVQRELPDARGAPKAGNVSRYFTEHPEMVLGEEGFFDKLYKDRYAVHETPGTVLSDRLAEAFEKLPENVMDPPMSPEQKAALDFSATEKKEGSFYTAPDGRLMQYSDGAGRPVARRGAGVEGGKTAAEVETIRQLLPIRDTLRDVFRYDLSDNAEEAAAARARLNRIYDDFVKRNGPLNKADISYRRPNIVQQENARAEAREEAREMGERWDEGDFDPTAMIARKAKAGEIARARVAAREEAQKAGRDFDEGTFDPDNMPDIPTIKQPNLDPFEGDQELYRLAALEDYDPKTGVAQKRRVFYENTLTREQEPELKSATDGILWSMDKNGRLDIDSIAEKLGIDRNQVIEDLGDHVIRVPGTEEVYEPRDAYLSGDVVSKLAEARAAADRDPRFQKNVSALEAAQPEPLSPAEIAVHLGMPWLPPETIREFTDSIGIGRTNISYSPLLGKWVVDTRNAARGPRDAEWGTEDYKPHELLSEAMNGRNPVVRRTDRGPPQVTWVDTTATQAAQDKANLIKEAFETWAQEDPERAHQLAELYNSKYNRVVLRNWNGDYLTTPGVSSDWHWRPHQTRVVARIIQDGSTYMAHAVGAGKTSAMIGAGMEMRRLGLVNKPMYTVPNHMLGQFAKEFYEQYPTARIAVADDRNFHTSRRKQFVANVAQQDLDAIIITHSAFKKVPISDEFGEKLIREATDEIDEVMRQLGQNPNDLQRVSRDVDPADRVTVKQLQKKKERLEQKLRSGGGDQDVVNTFEEMGVDFLFVDEAHCFPYKAKIATDQGLMRIGDIVEQRLPVRVASYDHLTRKVVWRRIHNYWRHERADKAILSIKTERGEVNCTANHQVFVEGRGYVQADEIRPGENLLSLRETVRAQGAREARTRAEALFASVCQGSGKARARHKNLRLLPPPLLLSTQGPGEQRQAAILFDLVSGQNGYVGSRSTPAHADGGARWGQRGNQVEGGSRGKFEAHARTESHAAARGAGEDASQSVGPHLFGSWREWPAHRTADAYPSIDGLTDGASDPDESRPWEIRESAELLQGGSRRSGPTVGDRDRRTDAQAEALAFPRCPEDRCVDRARVVSVEVLERGSERERRCCGGEDRYVYDLGIEGEHNYFADGTLVHNSFRKLSFVTQTPMKGITSEGSDMAWDLYTKIRYLDENRPGRSLVMASGTPVTNTMGELYSLSRYMQPQALKAQGLSHFDSWRQAFADTKTDIEQTATGAYEPVTRLAKFVNMPELYKMVGSNMDVVTSEQLAQYVTRPELEGGKRDFHLAPRSNSMEEFQQDLGARVQAIKARRGPPSKGDDILLSVIGDGRKAAIDMRLVDPTALNDPNSKLNQMIDNVHRIWEESKDTQFYDPESGYTKETTRGPATQMVFSNLGIKGGEGKFSAYDWMRREWVRRGIPANEIAFIKDYTTPVAKQRLLNDVNDGKVRILVGSTQKMGTGINAQKRLLAIHNLDPLWFPADDEQRNGRGLRQGNMNPRLQIHDYSTKGTYDSTMWAMMARKGRFIEQFFRGDPKLREMEDIGEASQYEQAAAMATSDERVIKLVEMQQELTKMERREKAHRNQEYTLEYRARDAENEIEREAKSIRDTQDAINRAQDVSGDNFQMKVGSRTYTERKAAGEAITKMVADNYPDLRTDEIREVGEIGGFPLTMRTSIGLDRNADGRTIEVKGATPIFRLHFGEDWSTALGSGTGPGVIQSAAGYISDLPEYLTMHQNRLADAAARAQSNRNAMGKPFTEGDKIESLRQQVRDTEAALSAPPPQEEAPVGTPGPRTELTPEGTMQTQGPAVGGVLSRLMRSEEGSGWNPFSRFQTPDASDEAVSATERAATAAVPRGTGWSEQANRILGIGPRAPGSGDHNFNFINKNFTAPRSKASLDQRSSVKWQAELAKVRDATTLLHGYRDGLDSWQGKPVEQWRKLFSAMEVLTLEGREIPLDGRAIIVENRDRPYAALSKVGDVIRLTSPDEIQMFTDYRRTMNQVWQDLVTETGKQYGWTGTPTSAAIRAAAEAAPDARESRRLERAAKIVAAIEYQHRTAYLPLMRSGDYFLRVKPSRPNENWTGEGFAPTVMFKLIDSLSPGERATGGRQPATPRRATEAVAELRKTFPEGEYEIDHGHMFRSTDAIRDLDIPAIDKLMMLVGNDARGQISERLRNTGMGGEEARRAAQADYDKLVDVVLDQIFEQRVAGFKRQRKGIAGYDEDFAKSTGRYLGWLSNYVSGMKHRADIEVADQAIERHPDPRTRQFWRDWDRRQEDYGDQLYGPLAKMRQGAFLWYLGMNAATTAKIMLHGPLRGVPVLTTGLGAQGRARAAGEYLNASRQLAGALTVGKAGIVVDFDRVAGKMSGAERELLADSEAKGILHPQTADELAAIQRQGEEALTDRGRFTQRVFDIWSSNVSSADRMVRGAMLLSAYRTANRVGMDKINQVWDKDLNWGNASRKTPEAFAQFMVDQTVGIWGDFNRLPILRSQLGGMIGQFKTYEIGYLSNLNQMLRHMGPEGKVTAALMMGGVGMMGGLFAIPFAQDIADATNWAYKLAGGIDLETDLKHAFDALLGEGGGSLALHGGRPGGIDWSGIGFGDIVSKSARSLADVAGAAPSAAMGNPYRAYERYRSGQGELAAARELLPNAVKHVVDALYPEVSLTSTSGASKALPESAITEADRGKILLGFQPAIKTEHFEKMGDARRQMGAYRAALTLAEDRIANLTGRGEQADANQAMGEAMQLIARGQRDGVYSAHEADAFRRDLKRKIVQRLHPEIASKTMQRIEAVQRPQP